MYERELNNIKFNVDNIMNLSLWHIKEGKLEPEYVYENQKNQALMIEKCLHSIYNKKNDRQKYLNQVSSDLNRGIELIRDGRTDDATYYLETLWEELVDYFNIDDEDMPSPRKDIYDTSDDAVFYNRPDENEIQSD